MKRGQIAALAYEAGRIASAVAAQTSERWDALDDDTRRGVDMFLRLYVFPWLRMRNAAIAAGVDGRRHSGLGRMSLAVIEVGRALLLMLAPTDLSTGGLAS
ncbi:MAG: hypothetical protein U0414_42525 [Polyangiaceae bacterium]